MEGNTLGDRQQSSEPAQCESWLVEPNGDLSTLTQTLRLNVRCFDGFARYLVLRRSARGERDAEVLLSSGTATNMNKAKAAAQQAATRLESMLGRA
jgi:hypothetical protein